MTEDLIARLKAAHEAATPGPWEGALRSSMSLGMDGSQARIDGELIVLLRNHAAEIIAALEEHERLRAALSQIVTAISGPSINNDTLVIGLAHIAYEALEKKG